MQAGGSACWDSVQSEEGVLQSDVVACHLVGGGAEGGGGGEARVPVGADQTGWDLATKTQIGDQYQYRKHYISSSSLLLLLLSLLLLLLLLLLSLLLLLLLSLLLLLPLLLLPLL